MVFTALIIYNEGKGDDQMEFQSEDHRVFAKDQGGHVIAEVTFPEVSADTAVIDHTFVDDSLRGREWPENFWKRRQNSWKKEE